MKLDITPFRLIVPELKIFIEKYRYRPLSYVLSEFAAMNGVHIISLYIFYGEMYGESDKITNRINELKNFYKITKIEG